MAKYSYRWNLSDGYDKDSYHGKTVFGTFVCAGGSTMGYKLAGYNHLGGVEIDPRMGDVYVKNHNPSMFYLEDIRKFNERNDLPDELYNLDVLDGSPPCSSFSMSGARERDWGKSKSFKEGQANQVLDDLVYEYCDTIRKLIPKVAILENVTGIVKGNAKMYALSIVERMSDLYDCKVYQLDASTMGVPLKRVRVFFLFIKKSIGRTIDLSYSCKPIPYGHISDDEHVLENKDTEVGMLWDKALPGDELRDYHVKGNYFGYYKVSRRKVLPTIVSGSYIYKPDMFSKLSKKEYCLASSFPCDFDFMGRSHHYITGMSVPPVMMAMLSRDIYEQILKDE